MSAIAREKTLEDFDSDRETETENTRALEVQALHLAKLAESTARGHNLYRETEAYFKARFVAEEAEVRKLRALLDGASVRLRSEKTKRDEIQAKFTSFENEISQLKTDLAETRVRAEREVNELTWSANEARKQAESDLFNSLAKVRGEAAADLDRVKAASAAELAKVKADATAELAKVKSDFTHELNQTKTRASEKAAQLESESAERFARAQAQAVEVLTRTQAEAADKFDRAQALATENLERLRRQSSEEIEKLESKLAEALAEKAVASLQQAQLATRNEELEMARARYAIQSAEFSASQSALNAEVTRLSELCETLGNRAESLEAERDLLQSLVDSQSVRNETAAREVAAKASQLERQERRLGNYAEKLRTEKSEIRRMSSDLAGEILAARNLHPLRDYLSLTEFELAKIELQLKKTPTSAPERARLETCLEQIFEQRSFLRILLEASQKQLDQQAATVLKLAEEDSAAPVPPLPPRLTGTQD